MAGSSKSGADWNTAIQVWFDEHKKYTFGQESSGTGHYTQVNYEFVTSHFIRHKFLVITYTTFTIYLS